MDGESAQRRDAGAPMPTLEELLRYQNPRAAEYRRLIQHEEINDLSWMDQPYGHAAWIDDMPLMKKEERASFADGYLLDDRVKVYFTGLIRHAIGTQNTDELPPIGHYVEAVRAGAVRKVERFMEQGVGAEEAELRRTERLKAVNSRLKFSDPETIQELDTVIDEFNADLERIKTEQDFVALSNFNDRINTLFNKKVEMGKEFTEQYFQRKLHGQLLLDLGGGRGNHMAQFAKQFGVSVYMNVDKFLSTNFERDQDGIKIIGIRADMLEFLSRLQSGSVSITINGIDAALINNMAYHRALADEIERVASKDGVIFGYSTVALDILAKRPGVHLRECSQLNVHDAEQKYILERK